MFKIKTSCGMTFPYSPRSYDMACRVAYFLRQECPFEILVVGESGRAMSEVHEPDAQKDRYAKQVVRRLL